MISAEDVDIYTDQIVDAFDLMQQQTKILRTDDTQIPSIDCKPAEFGLPDDFPVSLPGSDHPQSRPRRPVHDGATHWNLDLGALFQTHGV